MLLLKQSAGKTRLFYLQVAALGLVNTVLYSTLLFFINAVVADRPLPFPAQYGWVVFGGVLLVSFLLNRYFQVYLIGLTHSILLEQELSVIDKLRQAPLAAFEQLGAQRVYAAIGDTRIVSQVPEIIVNAVNGSTIILCALGYLLWTSFAGGLALLLLMAALFLVYTLRNKQIERDINRLRDLQNDYFRYIRDLLEGFREVKMSRTRNGVLFNRHLKVNREKGKDIGISTSVQYMNNELFGSYSWLLVLGAVLFGVPGVLGQKGEHVLAFVVTILYIMAPLATLVNLFPLYTRVKVALDRIGELESILDVRVGSERCSDVSPFPSPRPGTLRFADVRYEYYDAEKRQAFVLGPLNLEITEGELVFVTGGNGSGKSTFIHLLTGLYQPTSGAIYLDGQRILPEHYPHYRDRISAIFTNHHLFHGNYDDFQLSDANAELNELVARMRMDGVVRAGDEPGSIDTRLSKGQQKRLALIYALLEKKQVLVLDEWAAEQDPEFRAYFYRTLLDEFRRQGKTTVLVTHDDAYFGCAGRLIRFDYGQIVSDVRRSGPAAAELLLQIHHA